MPGEFWADHIRFFDFERRLIHGHTDKTVLRIGDELRAKMKSGKTVRFLIIKIEYYEDPPDQFFGTVKDFGYLE